MNFPPFRIFVSIYLLSLSIVSCNTYAVSWDSYRKNEIAHYDLRSADTIFDVTNGNTFFDPFLATTTNNLHFYLAFLPSSKIKDKYIEAKFKDYLRRYAPDNKASFKLVQNTEDTIFLHANSVTKILCRDRMYGFKNLPRVTDEFYRLLKPGGTLIIVQEEFEISDKMKTELKDKPYPRENDIVAYFESRGFKLAKSREIVLNKRSGPAKLIHFVKQ